MVYQPRYEKYQGLRALILTRVSTGPQEKKFSHASQERGVREDITNPLMLHVIDVIHDTYTGLDYQYREALDRILCMAEQREFDVLCMDVLDRGLGRKAIARELYRTQLRDFGIHILTTEPSDHADDDTFEGQRARLQKGLKAEEEILDIVRRTKNGRREKALGNSKDNIPPQVVGTGTQHYGYRYVRNNKGTRIGYELNHDVIYVDKDGVEWTEVKVVIFIFKSAADGISLPQIATILNEKGIPTSFAGRGIRSQNMKEEALWQRVNLGRIVKDTTYYGEHRYGQTVSVQVPGHKRPIQKATPPEEHIIVPIPEIVTRELWEKANRRIASNRQTATRNNKVSKDCLLRGGFARCAYCERTLSAISKSYILSSGAEGINFSYKCSMPNLKSGRCPGSIISVDLLDADVAQYIRRFIQDTSKVDQIMTKLLAENIINKQQQKKLSDLKKILRDQEVVRANLAAEMKKKTLSERTTALLGIELDDLEQQEQEIRNDLAKQQRTQQQHEDLDCRIAAFHKQCQEWRGKLDGPMLRSDFHFFQEAVIFFGIYVKVWKANVEPRYQIYMQPPTIADLLS